MGLEVSFWAFVAAIIFGMGARIGWGLIEAVLLLLLGSVKGKG